jgi:hypothetical protein
MGRSKEEISADMAKLQSELDESEEKKEAATVASIDAKKAGDKKSAALQEQIARASEDSIAETNELMRELLAELRGTKPPPKAGAEEKSGFFDWLTK